MRLSLRLESEKWQPIPMQCDPHGEVYQTVRPMPPGAPIAYVFGVDSVWGGGDWLNVLSKDAQQFGVRGSPAGVLANVARVATSSAKPMPRSADGTQGFDRSLESAEMPFHDDLLAAELPNDTEPLVSSDSGRLAATKGKMEFKLRVAMKTGMLGKKASIGKASEKPYTVAGLCKRGLLYQGRISTTISSSPKAVIRSQTSRASGGSMLSPFSSGQSAAASPSTGNPETCSSIVAKKGAGNRPRLK